MKNYNQKDLDNANRVITQCKKYITEQLGEYLHRDDFPTESNLLTLELDTSYHSRGNKKYYLSLNYEGLVVKYIYSDGFGCTMNITTCDPAVRDLYTYNESPQKTIDLAYKLVKNWADIKDKISTIKSSYISHRSDVSKTLADFQI